MKTCNLNMLKAYFAKGTALAVLGLTKSEFLSEARRCGRVRKYGDSEIVRIMKDRGWDCTGPADGSCPDREAAADWAAYLIGR